MGQAWKEEARSGVHLDSSKVSQLPLFMILLQEGVKTSSFRQEVIHHPLRLLFNLEQKLKEQWRKEQMREQKQEKSSKSGSILPTSWLAVSSRASKVSGLTFPCLVSRSALRAVTSSPSCLADWEQIQSQAFPLLVQYLIFLLEPGLALPQHRFLVGGWYYSSSNA